MNKTLAVLVLGAAISTFSIPKDYAYDSKIFSYEEINPNPNKQSEKIILDFFNTLNIIRELSFEKKWDMHGGLEFDFGVKFDYDIQLNPIKFIPISFHLNFLLQYNF